MRDSSGHILLPPSAGLLFDKCYYMEIEIALLGNYFSHFMVHIVCLQIQHLYWHDFVLMHSVCNSIICRLVITLSWHGTSQCQPIVKNAW